MVDAADGSPERPGAPGGRLAVPAGRLRLHGEHGAAGVEPPQAEPAGPAGKGRYPLVWAESVRAEGVFEFRAERRNHKPWFEPKANERWVVTDVPCVLLQRTTAKEQCRRLIAAELPAAFIEEHGAVVVENHLNMIKPLNGTPQVAPGRWRSC